MRNYIKGEINLMENNFTALNANVYDGKDLLLITTNKNSQ